MKHRRLPPDLGNQYDLRNLILRRRHGILLFKQDQIRSPFMPYCIQEPRLNKRLGRFLTPRMPVDSTPSLSADNNYIAPERRAG